ncbi:MAG: formimidoylglutamase [Ferruginibacter sp.]
MYDLMDFLDPVSMDELTEDNGLTDGQLARNITFSNAESIEVDAMDIVLVGAPEMRGSGYYKAGGPSAPDMIRKHLYPLHYWHPDVQIGDIGNVRAGDTLTDSYAAIKTVVAELLRKRKTVVILGGSHDITLAQYEAYCELDRTIEATCIDATIDLRSESTVRSENFLLDMLTNEPSKVKHYNHIGFQSYFVHPRMIETLDKLRFDCYRAGKIKENIEDMEPVIRNSHLVSFDINAIKNSDSPASKQSPNGLDGIEACMLSRYAGMSTNLDSFGIYGYVPEEDSDELTAMQIAQMIWYFIDGKNRNKQESSLSEVSNFNEYHTAFAEVDTIFLQSKRSGRWWMQMPGKRFTACSYSDYQQASNNEIPERWLRMQERES